MAAQAEAEIFGTSVKCKMRHFQEAVGQQEACPPRSESALSAALPHPSGTIPQTQGSSTCQPGTYTGSVIAT